MEELGMRKFMWLFCACLMIFAVNISWVAANQKSADNLSNLTELWDEEKREEVLVIGQRRLENNPKDLLGLLIVLQDALFVKCDAHGTARIYAVLDTEFANKGGSPFEYYSSYWQKAIPERIEKIDKMTIGQKEREIKTDLARYCDQMPFFTLIYPLLVEHGAIDLLGRVFEGKNLPISEKIFRLYEKKRVEEVFEIGEKRLKRNPQDILGLVIQFDEAIIKCDPDAMSRAATMLDRRLNGIKNKTFQKDYLVIKKEMFDVFIDEVKKMSPEQRSKEREANKDMTDPPPLAFLLMFLEQEGLLANAQIRE